ncbi:uncharacterized protein LOC144434213 [Glandiceps talaboti]
MSPPRTSRFVYSVFVSAVLLHAFNPDALSFQHRSPGTIVTDGPTNSQNESASGAILHGLLRPNHDRGMFHFRLQLQRISLIRSKILNLLGKTDTPRIPKAKFSDQERQQMVDLYERTLNETEKQEEEEETAATVKSLRVINGKCESPDINSNVWTNTSGIKLYFDVSGYTAGQHKVVSATLKIHKRMVNTFEVQDSSPASLPDVSHGTATGDDVRSHRPDEDDVRSRQLEADGVLRNHRLDSRLRRHQLDDYDVTTRVVTETRSSSVANDSHEDRDVANVDNSDDDNTGERIEVRITAYQLKYHKRNAPPFRRKLIDTKAVAVDFEGWIQFQITNTVQKWIDSPSKNYGLEIIVEPLHEDETKYAEDVKTNLDVCSTNETMSYEPPTISEMYDGFYPILDVVAAQSKSEFSMGFPGKRSVRSSKRRKGSNSGQCSKETTCCKSQLYVSFEELHWESWILLPKGFNTSFCTGSCVPVHIPGSDDVEKSYFWHQTNLKHSEKNTCCGPTKLKPLTILYIDNEGTFNLVTFKDFIVDECGCRP